MAITIKDSFGNNSTPSVTGTPNMWIKGVPVGSGDVEGLYQIYSGTPGANGTYYWVADLNRTVGSGARTTYIAFGF